MKPCRNKLSTFIKPWAIKAAGQPFVYFDYNAAGDNIRVYSSIANDWERIYTYDLLGRKLTYTEGNIVENYAYTGNLLTLHTQQYYDNNVSTPITSQTTYTYNAHRLQSVNGQDEVPVVYHYDSYGRVDTLYDESGLVCYQYGNMGEITRETRIYTVPFLSNIIALSTQFEYDSWGRILNITYPDNEEVNYSYDFGGQLERIANNQNYTYLDSIQYNKFGAKISQKYGNGIQTKYTYYPLTQRLDSLLTTYGGNTLSYLQYTYDSVGNIIRVNSSYPMPQYQVTERYTYDSADQLLTAESTCNNNVLCSGAYTYNNWGKINTYTQQTTDPATNISENKNYRYYFPSSSADMAQGQTSFAPIIKYDMQQNTQPLETCTYGINGSIRKRLDHQTQNTDYYYFNASGNLKACGTDMQISLYGYNASNTRTYKVNLFNANQWVNGQPQPIQPMVQNAMFYPNTYINFTQAGEYTKHYYNGTERIASRLGEQQIPISVDNNQELEAYQHDVKQILYNSIGQHLYEDPTDMQEGDLIPLEFLQATGDNNAIFYYHPNHLASTMYVTNAQQSVVQSFLYAPYGDIISEYHPGFNGNVLPNYAFNAKELDEETGMYYYEARYYAPPVFTSRDPMFEKYFWMSPYAYCANNPVKYVDPSGEEVSTHTDENGRVIAVFDDGDNGVYRHGRNADGSSVTEYQITKRHENKGTSAGGTYMGESLHSLSFADQSLYNTNGQIRPMPGMIIDFDSDELTRKANSIIDQSPSLYQYQKNADKKGDWNLKKDIKHGSLLYGKYASPRDAGNFIAGMVAASGGFLREEVAQIGYGAYNLSGNSKFKTALILLNVARVCRRNLIVGLIMLEYVKNGEDFLSQRCIDLGKVYQRNKK